MDSGGDRPLEPCYCRGKGVAQDNAEAVKWWRKAANQGNEDAKRILRKLGIE